MKNLTVPVSVFVAILGCVLAVSANVTTTKIHQDIDKERYRRISAEEQLQKAHGQIAQLATQLKDAQQKLGGIEQVLQGKTTTLQGQLEKVTQEKAALIEQVNQLQKAVAAAQPPAVEQQGAPVPPVTP